MKKLLIYIVAFNHEKFIEKVLNRIDKKIFNKFETEILINDDHSTDNTLKKIKNYKNENENENYKINILSNPKNLGYGGNQKIGYHYAIKNKFDYVALLHGDGQYAPEVLENLIDEINKKNTMAVFGSRMITKGGALKGGMPVYKFIGNKILTFFQNIILSSNLSEFHSGYRVYKVEALNKIPFHLNANDYSFDTEIIIQFLFSNFKIAEYAIPTYYGEEISYVNGFYYAYRIMIESFKAKIQKYNLMYDPKYDVIPEENNYLLKDYFSSPHSETIKKIKNKSIVLDLGCNDGSLGAKLILKNQCYVIGSDSSEKHVKHKLSEFQICDLNIMLPNIDYDKLDYIIILDVIEHLKSPEKFMVNLYNKILYNEKVKILISTPNISFFVIRFMLLFGSFNYGKKGILDRTHTRLFTFSTFEKLITASNFRIIEKKGIPPPYPLAIGKNLISRILLNINSFFIIILKSLFSYQIFLTIKPNTSLELLLKNAEKKAKNLPSMDCN